MKQTADPKVQMQTYILKIVNLNMSSKKNINFRSFFASFTKDSLSPLYLYIFYKVGFTDSTFASRSNKATAKHRDI